MRVARRGSGVCVASADESSEAVLDEYRRKRDPGRTPEPFGSPEAGPGPKRRFVVQRHAARRLHYDLRLERDGVLASWAVPKGLPLDRGSRRRAIHTEDHPLEYLDFAGVIPSGEYGAGVMDIYDSGEYELVEESASGSLTFTLAGGRLRGRWTLAAAHLDGEERNWLLIRRDGRKASLPRLLPMLATLHREIPAGEWLFEVKWDGYRTIARLHEGDVTLTSRRGQDLTERFRAIAQRLGRGMRVFDCVLDGEVCALDRDGRPTFSLLQQNAGTLVYFVFDLLELEREPLTARPLSERRELLQSLVDPSERTVRFSEAFDDGRQLLELARKQRLEGVVAKRPSSRYLPGARSRDWLKIKTRSSDTFVVAGYVYGEGSRQRFGSLVIARRENGRLVYAGTVGAGFSAATIEEALARTRPLRRDGSPLDPVPKDPRLKPGKVVWLEPVLLAEIEYAELTRDGIVRAPAFKGFRDDVEPDASPNADDGAQAEIRRGKRVVRLSRLDYLWWPETTFRKADLIDYYRRISPVLLPHLRDRPFTLKRYLNGPNAPFEWIKDAPAELPDWVRRCPLPAKTRRGELVEYPLVNDELALIWMIDYGCIDLHLWYSRCDKPAKPDYVLFDLDPAGVDFDSVVEAALLLRELLTAIGLEAFVRTSGGDGLHVQVPVARRYSYADTRRFAEIVADALVRARPTLVTTERDLERRHGVFVDTKMNGEGMTIASVYSARPLPGPPVATPLDWDELDLGLDRSTFTPPVVLERVAERGDLHARLLTSRQRLEPALARVGA
jgi:bifunctional non-homologous end joining protein LigD